MLEIEKKYKSPLRKLVKFFEQSRDQWKEKYFQKKTQVKQLQNRVRYLERTKQEWKQKAKNLKAEVKPLEEKVSSIKKIKKKTVKTHKEY